MGTTDPLLYVGIAFAAIGLVILALSGVLWVYAESKEEIASRACDEKTVFKAQRKKNCRTRASK